MSAERERGEGWVRGLAPSLDPAPSRPCGLSGISGLFGALPGFVWVSPTSCV